MKFTTVERILSKLERDIKGTELNEGDVIEWIGDALEQLNVESVQEEAVAFLEVNNFSADIPAYFNKVIQVARDNRYIDTQDYKKKSCKREIDEICEACPECNPGVTITDTCGHILNLDNIAFYRPKFDLLWEYDPLFRSTYFIQNFTPIRLSQHSFFKSLICRDIDQSAYAGNHDVYDIVGNQVLKLRFSFQFGRVVLAYLRTRIDQETGYPLIPDTGSHTEAISYYVKWKIAEWWMWNGREGSVSIADRMMQLWLKYVAQANSQAKMPQTIDDYQDLQDMARKKLPDYGRYNRYFGIIKDDYYGSRRRK